MEGGYLVFLKLKDALTEESKMAIRQYTRAYARESGWHVPGMSFAPGYIRFRLTKDSSRAL